MRDSTNVHAFDDASYGIRQSSDTSHNDYGIVLGETWMMSARSSKQKIVTESSTELELVGLSDSAAWAIHLKKFVEKQRYSVGPVVIYNLSCMALMKRGGQGSERSRHINIRHFWVAEMWQTSCGYQAFQHRSHACKRAH